MESHFTTLVHVNYGIWTRSSFSKTYYTQLQHLNKDFCSHENLGNEIYCFLSKFTVDHYALEPVGTHTGEQ